MGANAGKCAQNKCCAGDDEINTTAMMQQAALDEVPPEEKGDPKEAMQKKIDSILAKGLLAFKMEEEMLTPGGDKITEEIAELLKPFPEMSVKIQGYSAEMTGRFADPADMKKLSLQRARSVRTALKGSGCENKICAEGMGHVDQKGSRCEISICDDREVERTDRKAIEWDEAHEKRKAAAAVAKAALEAKPKEPEQEPTKNAETPKPKEEEPKALRGFQADTLRLEVLFADANGVETPVQFTKKPLGLSFRNKTPICVSSVEGHAKERGVQKGWQVRAINGVGLRDKEFPEVLQFLREQSLALQDPEVAAAKLSPLNSFEVLFRTRGDAQKLITITKRPLGLAYKNSMPLVVTRADGHAIECGIEAGWTILAVNGESLEGKLHYEATWLMQVCLCRLKSNNRNPSQVSAN